MRQTLSAPARSRRVRRAINRTIKRKSKKRWSSRAARTIRAAPRTAEQFFAMSPQGQDRWTRMTHAVTKMRAEGVSLQKASQEFSLDPRTVIRLGGSALRKAASGRYKAKARDHLLRVLFVPSPEGLRRVATRDSRQASQLARYSAAVDRYLETGDASALRTFRGKRIIDSSGAQVPLMTNIDELDRLGSAGVLSFESLYARSV